MIEATKNIHAVKGESMFRFIKKKCPPSPVEREAITLVGGITDDSVKPVIEKILELMSADFAGHLDIYISSDGGFVGSALSLITMMDTVNESESYKFKIHTVALREVYSAAFLIWVCGYSRIVTKYSSGLIHASLGSVEGSLTDVKVFYKHFAEENEIVASIISKRTNLGRDAVEKMLSDNVDHFFDSEQLLNMTAHNGR